VEMHFRGKDLLINNGHFLFLRRRKTKGTDLDEVGNAASGIVGGHSCGAGFPACLFQGLSNGRLESPAPHVHSPATLPQLGAYLTGEFSFDFFVSLCLCGLIFRIQRNVVLID